MVQKRKEIMAVGGFILSGIILISLASYSPLDYSLLKINRPVQNLFGPLGAFIAQGLRLSFGLASFYIALLPARLTWQLLRDPDYRPFDDISTDVLLLPLISVLIALLIARDPFNGGGVIGVYLSSMLTRILGMSGTAIVSMVFAVTLLWFKGVLSPKLFSRLKNSLPHNSNGIPLVRKTRVYTSSEDVPLNNIYEQVYTRKNPMPWIEKTTLSVDDNSQIKEHPTYPSISFRPYEEDTKPFTAERPAPLQLDAPNVGYYDTAPDAHETVPVHDDAIYHDDFDFDEYDDDGQVDDNDHYDANDFEKKEIEEYPVHSHTETKAPPPESSPRRREDEDLSLAEKRVFDTIPVNNDYIIPQGFLQESPPVDDADWKSEIHRNSKILVRTLQEFGIESKVVNVNRGPVITLYEMQIAPGIKVNRIVSLSDDIAMALAASRVRIVAPIPGKSAVGVEIPNNTREMVTLGDIMAIPKDPKRKGLKVALGKDILGKPVILDLKTLPHLLIAGATGSGKSVCVNSIITSLIYHYDPNHVRFILVDPKMVELQLYNGMPHLLTPVITEPHSTPAVLKWATMEMERRYRLLSSLQTRDLEKYNEKVRRDGNRMEHLPYIVVIIDELADLMMVAQKEIEGHITRIAQKARAVGIHLVLATQRPSVDVITGIIKANFPARIAFQVAQKTDSRTIIDQNGAEKLLGKGDMLYQSPLSSFPVRIQGAYVSEDEIDQIVAHLQEYGEPEYIDIEESLFDSEMDELGEGGDELFTEALKIIEESRKASASYLQRRLSIGYNRAARMIEQMEELGYVGPQQGSKPREVFI